MKLPYMDNLKIGQLVLAYTIDWCELQKEKQYPNMQIHLFSNYWITDRSTFKFLMQLSHKESDRYIGLNKSSICFLNYWITVDWLSSFSCINYVIKIVTVALVRIHPPRIWSPFDSCAVSHGAQEIFKLLPHTFVDPSKLPEICGKVGSRYPFIYPIHK